MWILAAGCGGGNGDSGEGELGGPCYPNGTCNEGLVCDGRGVCVQDDSDPCDGVDCGAHGACASLRDSPVCVCDDGYHADDLVCVEDIGTACDNVDCSGHGACALVDDQAVCICDEGYHASGLTCVEEEPPACDGVDCSGHGFCATDGDGDPLCVCDNGYHPEGLTCVADPQVCDGVDCGAHGACVDDGGAPVCDCDAGYHADGLTCVEDPDVCAGVDCSGHGTCVDQDGAAACECDAGFVADGLSCVEAECADLLVDDFADGTVAPWTVVDGDVSVVDGRLRVVRVPSKWGVVQQALPQAIGGAFQAEARMQLLTSQSLVSLCLDDTRPDPIQRYCMTLNTKTENGSQPGAHLFVNGIHDNNGTDPDRELIESSFDPGTASDFHLRMIHTADGDLELFVDGASVGQAHDTQVSRFDRITLYGMQDTSGGHGGFFDDVLVTTCLDETCDLTQIEQLADLPQNLRTVASEPRDGFVYLLGGYETNSGASTQCLANVWRYDLSSGATVDLGAVLPYARCPQGNDEMAWADNGKLYISPGLGPSINNGWGSHQCIIEFDPAGPSATEKACFGSNRWGLAVADGRDGYVYFMGGWNGGSLTDIWRYDPDSDQLTNTGSNIPVAGNSLSYANVTTATGETYIFTNSYGGSRLYRFDPSDLSFTNLADTGFSPSTAWIGGDGRVYTLTGSNPDYFRQLIAFDPASGQLENVDLGQNVFGDRTGPTLCPDPQAGHLYAFGGPTSAGNQPIAAIERTACLP